MMRAFYIVVALAMAWPAWAQGWAPLTGSGNATLAITTTSARVTLPGAPLAPNTTGISNPAPTPTNVNVCNTGANPAYVIFSVSLPAVSTVASGSLVGAGVCKLFTPPTNTSYLAAITSLGATTLEIEVGTGSPLAAAASLLGISGPILYATAYGSCTWDATHDVGPCLNAALAAATAVGGGTVLAPAGTFGLSTMVSITSSSVCLQGAGGGVALSDLRPSLDAGTRLKWLGSVGGRMMSIVPAVTYINDCLGGLIFDGNSRAADGLYAASLFKFRLNDVAFVGEFNGGNVLNLDVANATADGFQNGSFIDFIIAVSGTSNQLRLGAVYEPTVPGWGNVAFNYFRNVAITGAAGTGILCIGCDNNHFVETRVFNSGTSIDLSIGQSGANLLSSNGNVFDHLYYSGAFVARGTTSFPTCTVFSLGTTVTCSSLNEIRDLDKTNGTADPTIETGAQLVWGDNIGRRWGEIFIGKDGVQPGLVAVEDLGQTNGCGNNAVTNGGAGTTAYLCNASTGAFIQFDNLNGSRISLQQGLTSSSNMVVQALAGTAKLEFALTTRFDAAPLPASDLGVDIGSSVLRFGNLNAKSWTSNNGTGIWVVDSNIGASGDGNMTFTHNGSTYVTLGSTGGVLMPNLSTSATVAGSLCRASDGTLIYKVGVNCF